MAINYHDILADAALRRNALVGNDAPEIRAAFNTRPLTAAQFNSTEWPFESFINDAANIGAEMVAAVCQSGTHPQAAYFRSFFNVPHLGAIPAVDANGVQRVGPLGDVIDPATNTAMTRKTSRDIARRRENPGGMWKIGVFWYLVDSRFGHIEHTLAGSARVTCWVFDRAAERARIVANQAMTLPDDWAEALICGIASLGVRDDAGEGQAAVYRNYYMTWMDTARLGATPAPTASKADNGNPMEAQS